MDTVLQIWLNGKPPEKLRSMMRGVHGMFKNYVLLTDANSLAEDPELCAIYESLPEWKYKSDLLRFWYLSKYSDVLYADCDVNLIKKPEVEDRLSFACIGSFYDHFLIYNGKDTEKCKKILDEAVAIARKNMEVGCKVHKSWMNALIQNEYGKIDQRYYKHG